MRAVRRTTAIELLQKLLPFEQQEIRPFVRHLCNLHELSRLECLTPLKAAQTAAVRDLRPAVAQTDLVLVLTASATKSGAALGSEVVYGRDYRRNRFDGGMGWRPWSACCPRIANGIAIKCR